MNKKLIFLILSTTMIPFTIINMCIAPHMSGNICQGGNSNCKILEDQYDTYKDRYDDNTKEGIKLAINVCKRENAMYNLEFTSLIFDVIAGSLCCILGLLYYFTDKYFEKITGIIGIASGVIGFIFTIVYLGYSAYIFNNHHSGMILLYDNGAKYKWDGKKYALPWTNEDLVKDQKANYAFYKDVWKKQYNYDSELYKIYLGNEYHESKSCNTRSGDPPTSKIPGCDYIWYYNYLSSHTTNYFHKYLYDTWLTSIIFTAFILVCLIGVSIFGLFIFLNKVDSGSAPISSININFNKNLN